MEKRQTPNLMHKIHLITASLDKLHVDMNGQNVPLKQLGQVGMPNANTLTLNMTSYPQVIEHDKLLCSVHRVVSI